MKICTCESCHYTFRYLSHKQKAKDAARSVCPTLCPDCGKKTIRIANRKEIAEYYKSQAILAEEIQMGLYAVTG